MNTKERKTAAAFNAMDSETRAAFMETLERRRGEMGEIIDQNEAQAASVVDAENNSKLADIAPKLYPLWDRIQRRKDQNNDLTIKEYRDITGKEHPAHVITDKQGREYVSWDNAIDNIATDYGYDTPEDLFNDLERYVQARGDAEGYREMSKMAAASLKGIESHIKVLNKIKEGKYGNLDGGTAEETGEEGPAVQATGKVNSSDGNGKTADAGTTKAIESSQENAVIAEVKKIFDTAAAKNLVVRTSAGHWDKDGDKWHYTKDITPVRTSAPSRSRNSLYLSIAPPQMPKGHPKDKAGQPFHIVPQHRTRGGALTRRSDR
jgi:hypothetical protein